MKDSLIVVIAVVALVGLIVLWPKCKEDGRQGADSSLAVGGADIACTDCLYDTEGQLSATLLDRLTLSTGELQARRAFPGRKGLNKWRKRQEQEEFWRYLKQHCPPGVIHYPGIQIQNPYGYWTQQYLYDNRKGTQFCAYH